MNAFANIMRQWERLAPYNAAQTMRLTGIDAARLYAAWPRAWRSTQLDTHGLHAAEVETVSCVLDEHLSRSLNHVWTERESFKPFVCAKAGSLHAGIVYRHCVADSVSIRLLMRRWLEFALDHETPSPLTVNFRAPSPPWWMLPAEIAREFARQRRTKSNRRLIDLPLAPAVHVSVETADGLPDRLRAAAKSRNAKVNDLFTVAALLAARESVSLEQSTRRTSLGVGSIVDIRGEFDTFGLSLGFVDFQFKARELDSPEDLIRSAALQAEAARRAGRARASTWRLGLLHRYSKRWSDDDLRTFYRKRAPLIAGVSNVNLAHAWPGELHPQFVSSYGRTSPLGPMTPIVFTPTSLGPVFHLGVTVRAAVGDRHKSLAIAGRFLDVLRTVAG